jgi:hypothetical protein
MAPPGTPTVVVNPGPGVGPGGGREMAVRRHEVGEDPGERLGLARVLVTDP